MSLHPDLEQGGGSTPQRLFANKYRDIDELEKGYLELQTQSNANYQRLQAYEAQLANAGRMNPADEAARRRDPREELAEVGVPPEAILELVSQGVAQYLQPMLQAQEARTSISRTFPDFDKLENDVAQFLNQNPAYRQRYERMFKVEPAGAMEWAYQTYVREAQPVTQNRVPDNRPDAKLPGSMGGMDRTASGIANEEELEKRFAYAKETGNWDQYVAARLNLSNEQFRPYSP